MSSSVRAEVSGPDGDEPYTLFVNQTEYGNARYRFAGLRLPAHQGPCGLWRSEQRSCSGHHRDQLEGSVLQPGSQRRNGWY